MPSHLDYLARVADMDVEHILEKERTYQGSWKKSGGRSAWFMVKRKIDRLLVMLAPVPWPESFKPEDLDEIADNPKDCVLSPELAGWVRDVVSSEDIFEAIHRKPSGADGTVLAEVRDLRRYLLLIEAEMMARGVVTAGAVTDPSREDPIYYGLERLEKNIADILNEPFYEEGGDMTPWRVCAEENPELVVYGRWAPGVWQMHETIGYNECPAPYRKWYYWLGERPEALVGILNRDMVKTTLPKFQVHINHSEWLMLSPAFQGLYHRANDGVYHIKDVFREGWT